MISKMKRGKILKLGKYLLDSKLDKEFHSLLCVAKGQQIFDLFKDSDILSGFQNEYLSDEDFEEWKTEFFNANKEFFKNYEIVRKLGEGGDGEAFLLKDGRVLKLFQDTDSLIFYKKTHDALHSGEAKKENLMVYDFGKLYIPDEEEFGPLAFAVMENLSLQNKEKGWDEGFMKKLVPHVTEHLEDQNPKEIWKSFRLKFPEENMSDGLFFESSTGPNIFEAPMHENQPLSFHMSDEGGENLVKSIIESLKMKGNDLAARNMGFRGETPVFFDPYIAYNDKSQREQQEYRYQDFDDEIKLALLNELLEKYSQSRYESIFKPGTRIRYFVDIIFKNNDQAREEWISDFLDRNSHILAKHDQVKYLGQGVYADAWATDDGRVIKFMHSDKDLPFYKEQMKELHSGKATAQTLAVFDMGVFDVPPAKRPFDVGNIERLSWVLMERLIPLRSHLKEYDQQLPELKVLFSEKDLSSDDAVPLLDKFKEAFAEMKYLVTTYLSDMKNDFDNKNHYQIAKDAFTNYASSEAYTGEAKEIFSNMAKRTSLPEGWLRDVIQAMTLNFLKGYKDLHSGNVGMRGDTAVYFDPSNLAPEPRTYVSKFKEEDELLHPDEPSQETFEW